MSDRFFCAPLPKGNSARLDGAEAHHLARVLRKNPGDEIEIFDGQGNVATAEIADVRKKVVELKIRSTTFTPRPAGEVTIATAVPKGERFRWLVEKAVELDVDRLIPLITARSVVKPGEGKRDKMEQAVIEACKQCRRNWLMKIEEPQPWLVFLEHQLPESELAVLAHPAGNDLRDVMPRSSSLKMLLIIGPEGGFTDEEVSQATAAGAKVVGLGRNILRIETAAITLAAFAALHRSSPDNS